MNYSTWEYCEPQEVRPDTKGEPPRLCDFVKTLSQPPVCPCSPWRAGKSPSLPMAVLAPLFLSAPLLLAPSFSSTAPGSSQMKISRAGLPSGVNRQHPLTQHGEGKAFPVTPKGQEAPQGPLSFQMDPRTPAPARQPPLGPRSPTRGEHPSQPPAVTEPRGRGSAKI